MEPIQAIAALIEDAGFGQPGFTLFLGSDPDIPDAGDVVVNIISTGGFSPSMIHNQSAPAVRYPTFQIMARHSSYLSAQTRLAQILPVLSVSNVIVDDLFFLFIEPVGDFVGLPPDRSLRSRVAYNVRTGVRSIVP